MKTRINEIMMNRRYKQKHQFGLVKELLIEGYAEWGLGGPELMEQIDDKVTIAFEVFSYRVLPYRSANFIADSITAAFYTDIIKHAGIVPAVN